MNTCPVCKEPMPPRRRDGGPRSYCSKPCADTARWEKTEEVLYEAGWLIDNGVSPDSIPDRLGATAAALARSAHRHDRHSLARIFDRIVRDQRECAA